MVVGAAILTVYQRGVPEKAIRALIVLVALLSTALTPYLFLGVEVIIHSNLVLLVFVSLFYDTLNHSHSLIEVFIVIRRH
jgi:hypothetical protein